MQTHPPRSIQLVAIPLVLSTLAGCASPLQPQSSSELQRSMVLAIEREVDQAKAAPERRTLSLQTDLTKLEIRPDHLKIIEDEYSVDGYLAQLGALDTLDSPGLAELLGEDLLGQPTTMVPISLENAIHASTGNNLDVEIARYAPAISEAGVVQAQAAFDWTIFGEAQYQDSNTPQPGQALGGGSAAIVRNASQTTSGSVGVRKDLTSGGSVSITHDLNNNNVESSFFGATPVPNPARTTGVTAQVTQPLLRGFGSDTVLSEVRLARNAERGSVSTLRSQLIATTSDTERAYWNLVLRYKELVIRHKLLQRGIEVRDDIKARRVQDARQAQVADAVARVERRRGDLLTARTNLRIASDQLKSLLNDPNLPVGSEAVILPAHDGIEEELGFSLVEAISDAVTNRPELETALLTIDDATIRETVAKNLRKPRLDLIAQARLVGLADTFGNAYDDTDANRFVDDWILGVSFEQPIGNRAGEAGVRSARLDRMRSVVQYRRAVQGIVLDVKDALNRVFTNHTLIEQSTLSRVAQGEALRSLIVEKELTNAGYSIERLNLELNQQEALAAAELAEASALVAYNTSLVDLYEAMGTTLQRNRIDLVVPDANQLAAGESPMERAGDGQQAGEQDAEGDE
ncbi:MAG: TolC family protein [Phycisphaerales bacterium]|nr:TolC family protein [Phycisphaerales bacterium]